VATAHDDESALAQTLLHLGLLATYQSAYDLAEARLIDALDHFRRNNDPAGEATATGRLGDVFYWRGEPARAVGRYERALRLHRELGNPRGIATTLVNLAGVQLDLADIAAATALAAEGMRRFREMDDRRGLCGALGIAGEIARVRKQPGEAATLFCEGLALLVEMNEQPAIPDAIEDLAGAALDVGDAGLAVRLFAAAATHRGRGRFLLSDDDRTKVGRDTSAAHVALGEATFASEWATGASWTISQAVTAALDLPAPPVRSDRASDIDDATTRRHAARRAAASGRDDGGDGLSAGDALRLTRPDGGEGGGPTDHHPRRDRSTRR
jgi:tetratricopeptide (TPR) repeat protein